MKSGMLGRVGLASGLVLLVLVLAPNARSLYEGIFFYLRDAQQSGSVSVKKLNETGRYAALYELVRLTNRPRRDYIFQRISAARASAANITVISVPIPDSAQDDLFVTFNSTGPYVVFSAHYDKLRDNAEYQGASDNTAAVTVLLAAVTELARQGYRGSAAFLFTGEEETGLRGSTAFCAYARANNIALAENVNFDNIGRGKLAIRPSVSIPGFTFVLPLLGDFTYDGRQLRSSPPYRLANARLTRALLKVDPEIVVYERFSATSDSNVFEANGIDSVAISGDDMYYLEQTWHTFSDTLDRLDERNLDRAFDLVVLYAQAKIR